MVGSGGEEMAQRASWWLQGAACCQLRTILGKKKYPRDITHKMVGNRANIQNLCDYKLQFCWREHNN